MKRDHQNTKQLIFSEKKKNGLYSGSHRTKLFPNEENPIIAKSHFRKIRFDRNEISGAFGDIGTDLPLIIGMILASGIDGASAFILFGLLMIASGVYYGIPMPVQPLKAVAVIVIAQKLSGPVIFGAGLAIGFTMLVLNISGILTWLARLIPKAVIRGIQLGLGIQLSMVALNTYIHADGIIGYFLAGISFLIVFFLLGNRKYPPALIVIGLGAVYAFLFRIEVSVFSNDFGLSLPIFFVPTWNDIISGFLLLALPQIPLSIGNSILATKQLAKDYFPEKNISVRKIGLTYSIMNLIAPFFSGIPVCHGSGGMAGHYAFGGRTGGSVIIYGSLFLGFGLLFSQGFSNVIQIFPQPVLGVILLFEGIALIRLIKDTTDNITDYMIAVIVGVMAAGLPYGYVIAITVGTVLYYAKRKELSTSRLFKSSYICIFHSNRTRSVENSQHEGRSDMKNPSR